MYVSTSHATIEKSLNVLVVDDEDYVADMIATTLELEGYHVDVAHDGQDGLRRAKEQRFHLIIVDVMMPRLSGPEMVQHLRELEHVHDTPIVLISVGPRPEVDWATVRFMRKPFDIDGMLSLVKQTIGPQERGG